MKAKSQEMTDSLAGAPDFETLFLAEMQARRERLAQWVQLIQEEVRLQGGPVRVIPRPAHHCRGLAARTRSAH